MPDISPTPIPTPPSSVLPKPSRLEIRAELQEMVALDLVGPAGGPDEEVAERDLTERYLCGLVAPKHRSKKKPQKEVASDGLSGGDTVKEEGPVEPQQPETLSMFPCSIGFTFCLPHGSETLRVRASWGHYVRAKSAHLKDRKEPDKPMTVWKRVPIEAHAKLLIQQGKLESWRPEPQLCPDVWVSGQARWRDFGWIITLFLENRAREGDQNGDGDWLYQAKLRVESPDSTPVFRQHHPSLEGDFADAVSWDERRQLAMLYRHCVEFAVGHNTSVHVERDKETPQRAHSIETTGLPTQEVERQDPPKTEDVAGLKGLVLSMNALADGSDAEILAGLAPLSTGYKAWIGERFEQLENEAELRPWDGVARKSLEACALAQKRIEAGIAVLKSNPQAMQAFRFANRTMAAQRVRSLWIEAKRTDEKARFSDYDILKNRQWRPFQLAFILLNLPSLCDPSHPDRSESASAKADLLWFPTGGGKTEAYLGLTAFTLAMRRLQGTLGGRDGGHGVAVLMRYTLRLLTLQQFQRAAALICACEVERRGDTRTWGREPFRLGLWVGAKTTPNATKDAADSVKNANIFGDGNGGNGTPLQFTQCPWCGAALDAKKMSDYIKPNEDTARTHLFCPNWEADGGRGCAFTERASGGEGVPAIVVDEEIYRRLPSLLIATVDKFAQMPWNGRTAMLFGGVNGWCARHGFTSPELGDCGAHTAKGRLPATRLEPRSALRPPDLIIQDELHLISGPLGTLVGLYETAIDSLCSWQFEGKRVRPKVVASTATVRNARRQIKALFARDVAIFPPPALDARDNFFSRQVESSDGAPSRLYVGVCAPGKRLKSALIRVYVAYMGAAQALFDKYPQEADPYLTTVGYFSSMRELGGMRRLIDDDVSSRLRDIDRRGLAKRDNLKVDELTSRKSGTEIPVMLDRMGATFDPKAKEERKRAYQENRRPKTGEPLDVLLATNMISVGVDVPRLGLMIVGGQPKATSEYIQATSRVGRRFPGVVCTVFNWARPRDLSHFESFEHYHSTFYQHVEALSVTPFASRALDRGLVALLVSLVRLGGDKYNPNAAAGQLDLSDPRIQAAIEAITARAESVEESKVVGDEVESALKVLLDDWSKRALDGAKAGVSLGFREERGGGAALLDKAGAGAWSQFTCLNSLRDVEPMCNLILNDTNMDSEP